MFPSSNHRGYRPSFSEYRENGQRNGVESSGFTHQHRGFRPPHFFHGTPGSYMVRDTWRSEMPPPDAHFIANFQPFMVPPHSQYGYNQQSVYPNMNFRGPQRPVHPPPPVYHTPHFRPNAPFHPNPRGRVARATRHPTGAFSAHRAPHVTQNSTQVVAAYRRRAGRQSNTSSRRDPVGSHGSIRPVSEVETESEGAERSKKSCTPDSCSESKLDTRTHDPEEEHSNLREKLIDQLRNGTYQCLVCISRVRQRDQIWSCSTCFHIYHLSCVKLWAAKCQKTAQDELRTAEAADPSWRCPACQTKYNDSGDTLSYFCFCRRIRNPEYHPARTNIPHSCDEICGKLRPKTAQQEGSPDDSSFCTHPCTELCHPGPCPPCITSVTLSCPCGQIQRSSLCGDRAPGPCGRMCRKKLSVNQSGTSSCATGLHSCLSSCHPGPCPPCEWIFEADCYCGLEHQSVTCGSEAAKRLRLDDNARQVIETACVEFTSLLVESQFTKLRVSEALKPLDRTTLTDGGSCDGDGNGKEDGEQPNCDFVTTSSAEQPPPQSPVAAVINPPEDDVSHDAPVQLLKPSPVYLGACFSCNRVCGRTLTCGHHTCPEPCHSGECKPCALDPSRCLTCPCGRTALSKLVPSGNVSGDRTSCSDPVPRCPNICARPQPICGHPCPQTCHLGPCPPCTRSLNAKCRCGRTTKELSCISFAEMAKDGTVELLCERLCKKKKVCGRHKCKNKCCELTTHPCNETCGRRLSCQQHNCEEPCHPGSCGTCWRGVIYTEITCRCGFSVLQPPQPCGSLPPECPRPCDRAHECDHPVRHTCHNEPTCPPCTVLLTKECPGGHGVQFSMPCFQPVLSCGRVCGHPLPNCSHTCQRNCHAGGCLDPAQPDTTTPLVCTQPCQQPRPDCGHPCALPCHEAKGQTCLQAAAASAGSKKSPESNGARITTLPRCRFPIDVVCPCGKRTGKQTCYQVHLKSCMMVQTDDPLSTHLGDGASQALQLSLGKKHITGPVPLLACDSSCTKAAESATGSASGRYADTSSWTRGLDLNPDQPVGVGDMDQTGEKLPFEKPEYSQWLKHFALHNFAFAIGVERQLYNMVLQLIKAPDSESLRSVTHHFPPMKEKRRRFIHELSTFYGIESHSMDPEPGRHVMVLAKRGETRFPGGATDHRGSLTALLQREFPGTVQLIDGVRVPSKTEAKRTVPSNSVTGSSYAQILSHRTDS